MQMLNKAKSFQRVLIANRAEIACRVAWSLRQLALTSIAVYTAMDKQAPHVALCDEAYLLAGERPQDNYLCIEALLNAAKQSGAEAIHPGYGFLSENADFAEAVQQADLVWIGPDPQSIRQMADKQQARQIATSLGLPTVAGSHGYLTDIDAAFQVAEQLGYPVLLKPAWTGGGKGMRPIDCPEALPAAWLASKQEAASFAHDSALYMEKLIKDPKHIEMQLFRDRFGNMVCLGERECSLQRRHQKLIEESPSTIMDSPMRQQMMQMAYVLAKAVNYIGAGTIECIVDANKAIYFIEMNTRLQVEHTLTECCFGVDLVAAQLAVAQHRPLPWRQEDLRPMGHAIEARLYAEDSENDFLPCSGHIEQLQLPHAAGVRCDMAIAKGSLVSSHYDALLGKMIVWAPQRSQARQKLLWALRQVTICGVQHNVDFLENLLQQESFVDGSYHTQSIALWLAQQQEQRQSWHSVADLALGLSLEDMAAMASVLYHHQQQLSDDGSF